MLTLVTYPAGCGQFSLSPFCVKAAYLLEMSGQPWQREDLNDPRKMPNQKLPALRTSEGLVADSDGIRDYLERKGADFDPGLTDAQKAHSRALIRMAEEHMYFHILVDRWCNDAVWPTIRETYFAAIPAPLRRPVTWILRREVQKGMLTQGLGRLSPEEQMARVEKDLSAIAALLWQGRFLLGDDPTAADLSVGSMLASMRGTPVSTVLSRRVAEDRILSDYIDRLEKAVPLP